jgi:hypothetical protein
VETAGKVSSRLKNAETEDSRFPPAHPLAISRGSNTTRRQDLRDIARAAGEEIDGTAFRLMGTGVSLRPGSLRRRQRHARPPRRARDGQSAQEIRARRGDPRHRL